MKCEEYKLAIGADPGFDGGAGHLSECAGCQTYRNEMQALDRKIGRALALDVPELVLPEMPDVDAADVVTLADRRRLLPPAWLSIAATVLLAVVLGTRFSGHEDMVYESLADEVLAHVSHIPSALQVTDVTVTDAHLYEVVPANIAQLDRSAGLITFAETCVIKGNSVPHLVIQGERGPVTIVLMPNEMVDEAVSLNDEHSQGVILPVGGGSIAIIGARGESLEKIEQQILQSVMWST